jgi:hypothetical protein
MHRMFLAAAMLAVFVSPSARARQTRQQPVRPDPFANVAKALSIAHPRQLLDGSDKALSSPLESRNYRLNDGAVPSDALSRTSRLNLGLAGTGRLRGITMRLRATSIVNRSDGFGGKLGVGPPLYASHKHLLLSLTERL